MKYLLIIVSMVLSMMLLNQVQAKEFSDTEKGYIVTATATSLIATNCKAKTIFGGLSKLGDRLGVDTDRLNTAIMATIQSQGDMKYDRDDLIPEVTRTMLWAHDRISKNLKENKTATCAEWLKVLQSLGTIRIGDVLE